MMDKREAIEKRISGIFSINRIVPGAITLSALCFGLTAIRYAMMNRLDMAVLCVLFAAFFDAMDGRAARFLGVSSQFGAELDSLSDLVCFGVAPGLIMYTVSLQHIGKIGWIASLYFVICCALRLARFNVGQINDSHALSANEKTPLELKAFFTGVPAPAGAIISLLPVVAFLYTGSDCVLSPYVGIIAEIVAGTLMISKIHTFSSKMLKFNQKNLVVTLLSITMVVVILIIETWGAILLLSCIYIGLIPLGDIEYRKRVRELESKNQ